MANNVSLRHFILGLLTRQPMSGYDIKRFLQRLSWLVGSPSFGSLYFALHALLENGLVTVEVIPRQDKPPRKIYTITEIGQQELQKWLDRPAASGASLRAFLMRLILASNLSPDGLIAHLEQRRDQVSVHQTALEETAASLEGAPDAQLLLLEYGMALAATELEWIDNAIDRLSTRSLPVEVVRSN